MKRGVPFSRPLSPNPSNHGGWLPAQPQGDERRLHRPVDDVGDLSLQGVKVDVVAQAGGKGVDGLRGVVAGSVESMVDRVLYAAAYGPEDGGRDERGRGH